MSLVFFDVTDVIRHATRNSTVVGIPRVQLNIVSLLARKHGGDVIRCIYWDADRQSMRHFDPSKLQTGLEFDAERLLIDLGLAKPGGWLPSQIQVKTYLKRYKDNKLLRAVKKLDIYIASIFFRGRVRRMGIRLGSDTRKQRQVIATELIDRLPVGSAYACLGSVWFTPEIWRFARQHKERGGTVVQMAHDLIPIHYPHYYPLNEQRAFEVALNNALAYATHIVCNSEWTAKDLRQYAKGKGNIPAVSVVPLAHEFIGFDRFTQIEASHELLYLAGKRFVLCVGTIEERKNFATLLEVWGKLLQGPETTIPMLVFAGKFGNGAESFQAALSGDSSLQHAVRVVYAPSDSQLAWLYQNSLFSVYPSKVEGWGLPVGESVWFGKYCVASNATSIPEVCGDLVDYVDPGDIEGLRRIVEHASSDAGFLKLREARIASATLRSWCDVADDIFKIVSGNGNAS